MTPRKVSNRRRRGQSGNEMVEFGLMAVFLVPLLLWVFVNGMNLIRMIQCTQICRDIGNQYIHGLDFSTHSAQTLASNLANGYGLTVSGFSGDSSGNEQSNTSNTGNGLVLLSEIMYVGTNACSALPSGTSCTNNGKYVFIQRVGFGNASIQFNGVTVSSALGSPTGATISDSGNVQNYLTDAHAVSSTAGNLITLSDSQVAYVSETFFADTGLGFSAYPAGGIYGRVFF
jgi:hypothetical protein